MSAASCSASVSEGVITTVTPGRLRAQPAMARAFDEAVSPAVIGTVRSRPAAATARAKIERSVKEGVLMLIGDRLAESS